MQVIKIKLGVKCIRDVQNEFPYYLIQEWVQRSGVVRLIRYIACRRRCLVLITIS